MGNVSIIVPIYNAESYIKTCLNSLLAQTWRKLEIILIDDGSVDGSGRICDEYATNNTKVKVIHKQNEGVSIARNVGLDVASGDYICFCDSDDYVEPNFVEILVSNIESQDVDISCCGYYRVISDKIFKNETTRKDDLQVLTGQDMYTAVCTNRQVGGYPWNKLFKKSIINAGNPLRFVENIAILEDHVFVLEYLKRCASMCFSEMQLYAYRDNPVGALGQKISDRKLTEILGRETISDLLQSEKCDCELQAGAWNNLMKTYCVNYKKLIFANIPSKPYWSNYIKQGYVKQKGQGKLDSSWTFKEKIYYLMLRILCIKSETDNASLN